MFDVHFRDFSSFSTSKYGYLTHVSMCSRRTGAVTWDMPDELKTDEDRSEENSQWLWIPHAEEAFVPAQIMQKLSGGNVRDH